MKRTAKLFVFLLLLSLLCACARNTPGSRQETEIPTMPSESLPTEPASTQPPEPVYDETPQTDTVAATVDGKALTATYVSGGQTYLRLAELAALLSAEGAVTEKRPGTATARGSDWYSGVLSWSDGTLRFDNGSASAELNAEEILLSAVPIYDGTDWYLPLHDVLSALGYTQYDDAEQNHLYYTMLPDVDAIPDGYRVPILMYHAVSDDMWGINELFVSPSEMEKQLQYLTENGYTPIWFEDLPNIAQYEKPVILTFDDGYDDNYEELYPLLQKYNVKATIFFIGGSFSGVHKMSAEQVKELSDSGLVSIQSHTYSHYEMETLNREETEFECRQSLLELMRVTGKQPFVLCYPSGSNNATTREVGAEYYLFGIRMNGGLYVTGVDRFKIPRYYVSRYTSLSSFASMVG